MKILLAISIYNMRERLKFKTKPKNFFDYDYDYNYKRLERKQWVVEF